MARGSRKGIGAAGAAARINPARRARPRRSRSCKPAPQPASCQRRHRRRHAREQSGSARQPAAASQAARPGTEEEKILPEGLGPARAARQQRLTPGQVRQGKRKGKQRGPREFVGPMDHSYRAVNGNVADGPASTIQTSSNGHGSYYQDSYHAAAGRPVREDAPTRIFCFIEDLFFLAKIQETARKLGVKVEFVKGDKELVAQLTDVPEDERPTLLVFDLNNLNAKPMTLIPKFKAKLKKATSIIGFLNHLQGDLKMKAIEAGCDTVMPRSAFSQSLPNLLRRYGLEEEEEYYPQPV